MTMNVIVCTDDDILPWPSCPNDSPPREHYPERERQRRDRRGRFLPVTYWCDS